MREDSSTKGWSDAGLEWIELAQNNDFRIYHIMPFTLKTLGDVRGKRVIDIGCGEGGYARELTKRGADVTAIDAVQSLAEYAESAAKNEGLSMRVLRRNSCELEGLKDGEFDIALCSMMLMDCEDLGGTLREARRVLKPGGRLFASVLHPCFNGKEMSWQGADDEKRVIVGNYFEPREWLKPVSSGLDANVVWRHRTLEDYTREFSAAGLIIKNIYEPIPEPEWLEKSPRIGWLKRIPMFLFWDLIKA